MFASLTRLIGLAALLAAGLALAPRAAHAAESYDGCTYTITSVPVYIAAQGVWCLQQDVATSITEGAAVTIEASNVTLDCNGFRIGGIEGGIWTYAEGVTATDVNNVVVKDCNIRSFRQGIRFGGNGKYIVEDSRFDANTAIAIEVYGAGSIVRRNIVASTGGSSIEEDSAMAIIGGPRVEVVDNHVRGVLSLESDEWGIVAWDGEDTRIARNVVGDVDTGTAIGMIGFGATIVEDNVIFGNTTRPAVICGGRGGAARGNVASGAVGVISQCVDLGGNDVL